MPIKRYEVVAFKDTGSYPDRSYSHCFCAVVSHEPMTVVGKDVRRLVRDYIKVQGILDGSRISLSAMRRGYVFRDYKHLRMKGGLYDMIEEVYGTRTRLLGKATFYFFGYINDPLGRRSMPAAPKLGKFYVVVEASTDRWPVPYAW